MNKLCKGYEYIDSKIKAKKPMKSCSILIIILTVHIKVTRLTQPKSST